jgi:tetratricopeptide (TPR) repeat protein
MTMNSNDSTLFVNKELDSNLHQQDGAALFARATLGSDEPLFPSVPSVSLDSGVVTYSPAPYASVPMPIPTGPLPKAAKSYYAEGHKQGTTEKELAFDRNFAVITNMMQHGAWPQALERLQALYAEYPAVSTLESLIDEATLKSELMAEWTHKIKGRRLTVGQEWLIWRSLPFLVLLALFMGGTVLYEKFVAPSRQVVAMERANLALIQEAAELVQVGKVDEGIALYNEALIRDPNNSVALQGLVSANHLAELTATYEVAMQVAEAGNLTRAISLLQSIQAESYPFRDVDAQLSRVSSLVEAERVYNLAEKSFAQHRWQEAITTYEQTQQLSADYQAEQVKTQLSTAYFHGAQKLIAQWPSEETTPEQMRAFLRKAQSLNAQNDMISRLLDQVDIYVKGERAVNSNNLDQAINIWRGLYVDQPAFLGGYLAEQLYQAYLTLASEVRDSDVEYARELYELAAAMPVADSSDARSQLESLGATVPTPQPTATPQPTVAYVAPVAVAPVVETPALAIAEPTPIPSVSFQGWIAFRSTRSGDEQIYVMRADGSEQQLAPEEISARLDVLYQEERRAPDGRLVYVQSVTERSDANVFVTSSDGVNTAMLTDYTGDEYDPVWSTSGEWIAFVANHTGNDEIWIMRAEGSEQRQLTFNNWEWDKHPTWSPDGSQIAFFSNRSGQRQVWAMSNDGSNQRNLSNNTYEDWDPLWIK